MQARKKMHTYKENFPLFQITKAFYEANNWVRLDKNNLDLV